MNDGRSNPASDAALFAVSVAKSDCASNDAPEPARAAALSTPDPTASRQIPAALPSIGDLAAGVRAANRAVLARAISLVESTLPRHRASADALINALIPHTGHATRIGITGVPGAGKSTFIQQLGLRLCDQGHRVAVLAIDPSSAISGGSILGDRTRMGRLAAHPNAYIRPSPAGTTLGGVARRTREASLLCEAAGFDVILIETVGVGQSEAVVSDMVDCVLGLAIAGAGDELQGIKRGVLERVAVIAVNKADGDNAEPATRAAADLRAAMRVLHHDPRDPVPVLTCSAATGAHIADVWAALTDRIDRMRADGRLDALRRDQLQRWLDALIDERLHALLDQSPDARAALDQARADVRALRATPAVAADRVIAHLRQEPAP